MSQTWESVRADLLAELGDRRRVDDYYLPVFRFIDGVRAHASRPPLVVGVSGAQGSGKSTLVSHAVRVFERRGLRTVAVSIDDFYLTRRDQIALAARHPGNRYLEHRGYPGTHDVELGTRTLSALRRREAGEVSVPRYDKGAASGRGDRAPEPTLVRTPLDVILLEGWMLGFSPAPESEIDDPDLLAPNAALARYEAWTRELDALVHLVTSDLDSIVRFRVEAERVRRDETGAGLGDDEARDYIERFLPAYRLWQPALCARVPIMGLPSLSVELGPDRLPLAAPVPSNG